MLRRMDQAPPIVAVKGEPNVFALPAVAIVGARNASLAGIKFARNLAAEIGARGLCHRLRPGARHRHGGASGQSRDRHDRRAGRRARPPLPARKHRALPGDRRARRRGHLGNAVRLGAARQGFSAPQPADRRPVARAGRHRGGQPLRLADQRAAGRRNGTAGLRGARLAARPARRRLQQAAQGRRHPGHRSAATCSTRSRPPPACSRCGRSPRSRRIFRRRRRPATDDRARVVEALGPTPIGVDEIIRHTGLHAAQVFTILLELDLAGRLERHAGGARVADLHRRLGSCSISPTARTWTLRRCGSAVPAPRQSGLASCGDTDCVSRAGPTREDAASRRSSRPQSKRFGAWSIG